MSNVISICGSATFYEEIREIAKKFEIKGITVHTPLNEKKTLAELDDAAFIKYKATLIKRQFDHIRASDAVLVANFDKRGVKNYIGANTFLEMAIAFHEDVPIYLLNPLPKQENIDELSGMQPVVIDGDIEKIILDDVEAIA